MAVLRGRHHNFMEQIKIYKPYFLPVPHLYHTADGRVLDSVTTIIKEELGLYQWGDSTAAERGTAAHKTCHYYDEDDLDESQIPENIQPYLELYKLALKAYDIQILKNEVRRFHGTYYYAGTVDKIAKVGGVLGIIDLKTGQEQIDHKFQLAAYKDMLKHEYPGVGLKRWCLYLYHDAKGVKPDRFNLIPHTGTNDFREFPILYAARNLKLNYGFIKRKGD